MRIKKRKALYKDGEYLVKSDLTDRIIYSSNARKLWNGQICAADEYEERNPQDFLRARPERRAIKDARPRQEMFLTTPITADDL